MKEPMVRLDFLRSSILEETVDLLGRIFKEFKCGEPISPITYGNAKALGQLINFYLKEGILRHGTERAERQTENDRPE